MSAVVTQADREAHSIAFLNEAARYFEKRPTNGEDGGFWSNVFNAKNCREIVELIAENAAHREAHTAGLRAQVEDFRASGFVLEDNLTQVSGENERLREVLAEARDIVGRAADIVEHKLGSKSEAERLTRAVDLIRAALSEHAK